MAHFPNCYSVSFNAMIFFFREGGFIEKRYFLLISGKCYSLKKIDSLLYVRWYHMFSFIEHVYILYSQDGNIIVTICGTNLNSILKFYF